MKVLHINSYYASGGKPTFYKNFFETLISRGVETEVYVPVPREMETAPEEEFGSYSHVVKTHNHRDRYLFFPKQNKIIKDAKERFAGSSFDVIHAHSLFTNGYVAYKLSRHFDVPYIVAVRNTDVNVFFRYMFHLKHIGYKIINNTERLIFINEPYKNTLIEKTLPKKYSKDTLKKSIVIPNGIDSFWHENRYSSKKITPGRNIRLLTIGQVSQNKNQLTVIKAAELLISKGFNVTYTIIGEIKDEGLFKKIQEYDFVELIPPMPKEELLPYYRKADVFVLPSKTETFGLVYAEAMTQGLPVIYTRGQGFDGQFEEGTIGYSVKHDVPAEIADNIQRILANYEAISENCWRLNERYDWEKIAREYKKFYRDIQNAF